MKRILVFFIIPMMFSYGQIVESFEGGDFPPEGWSVAHDAGSTNWVHSTTFPRSGEKHANSSNPGAGANKTLLLNLNVGASATTFSYWIAVSSLSSGTGATLQIFAGNNLTSFVLLRTIDLENLGSKEVYYQFTDYIDGTANESTNSIDLRGDDNCYIKWVHNKITGTAASLRLDDVEIPNSIALPVELISFTARLVGKDVSLMWYTVTETNNYGFEIERSSITLEGTYESWDQIGFVHGNGTCNSPKSYSFLDHLGFDCKFGAVKYRLKQIDIDGSYEYSNAIEIDFRDQPLKFELMQNYPNPFNSKTRIRYKVFAGENIRIEIYDMTGRYITTLVEEKKEPGSYEVDFSAPELTSGIYLVKFTAGNFNQTKKIVYLK